MPTPAYMYIEGQNQGEITKGCNTEESVGTFYREGHDDEFLVQEFNHSIFRPTDSQSGQPSGPRRHQQLVITKIFDKSSPLLYNALCNGEQLKKCIIKWYRTTKQGLEEHYFTHELEEATIIKIEAYMPHAQDPVNEHFTHLERVAFTYAKISWAHESASTAGSDDWRNPETAS